MSRTGWLAATRKLARLPNTNTAKMNAALVEREQRYRSMFESAMDAMFITDMDDRVIDANPAACAMHGYTVEELRAMPPFANVHPSIQSTNNSYLETLRSGKQFRGRTLKVRRDGSTFLADAVASPITSNGKPQILLVLRDITEQGRYEKELERRVAERTRELGTMLAVTNSLASTLDPSGVMALILDQMQSVVPYSGAAILLLDGEDLLVKAARGPLAADPGLTAVNQRFSVVHLDRLLTTLKRREVVVIDDVRGPDVLATEYRLAVGDAIDGALQLVVSWMGVPMIRQGQFLGMLTLSVSEAGGFTQHDADLALTLANQAAIALENARLFSQASSVAALEERQRLARELHDSVSQALYGIALGARTARRRLPEDAASEIVEPLDYVLSLAEAGMAEMRALIFELRPESLELEGLVPSMRRQIAATEARYQLTVAVDLPDEPMIPLQIKEGVYRIAQESLHNTVKHAVAKNVSVRLVCGASALDLYLRDDGQGFDPAGEFRGHLGLKSMRERAENLGGLFEIASAPGEGTRVHVWIPLERR